MVTDFEEFSAKFGDHTDVEYLRLHFIRFVVTQELAYEGWKWDKADILDIGAHWLHQSLLYALDGHRVTAAEFSNQLSDPGVESVASRHGINLLGYEDLSSEAVFDELPDNSIDVVLFCEILEHITFNPVGMWKAIYRVLRPGGRIIVTTPNFYRMKNIYGTFFRFLTGMGAGISVTDILNKNTNAPHWKEYSRKEIQHYFELLSSDFCVIRQKFFNLEVEDPEPNWKRTLVYKTSKLIPVIRGGIFASIELEEKSVGITIDPCW